jgi:hypothetical protein
MSAPIDVLMPESEREAARPSAIARSHKKILKYVRKSPCEAVSSQNGKLRSQYIHWQRMIAACSRDVEF